MANKELSALTAAGALDGTELIHILQGTDSVESTALAIAGLRDFAGASVSLASNVASGLNFTTPLAISSWDSQEFDTDALWDPCVSDRFTIPASLTGGKAIFTMCPYFTGMTANETCFASARHYDACGAIKRLRYRSTSHSSTAWATSITLGPVDVVTGDYFQAWMDTSADTDVGMTAQRSTMSIMVFRP